jgi:hypothetical protein
VVEALAPGFGATKQLSASDRIRPFEDVGTSHIAVGIWVATLAVLILPSVGRTEHRVTEEHILRAYSVAMSAFPLL